MPYGVMSHDQISQALLRLSAIKPGNEASLEVHVPCSLTAARDRALVYKPKRAIQRTNYMYKYMSLSAHVPYMLMLYTSE